MADNAVQFSIRLPVSLRDEVARLASEEHRSLNGQIVQICHEAAEKARRRLSGEGGE